MEKPIKTQKEARKVYEYLVKTTKDVLNISHNQAEKRVIALYASGILNEKGANPQNRDTQMKIDMFLQIPQP